MYILNADLHITIGWWSNKIRVPAGTHLFSSRIDQAKVRSECWESGPTNASKQINLQINFHASAN